MMRILIQPLREIDADLIFNLEKGLSEIFKSRITILPSMNPELACFNTARKQFNSTCLLRKIEPVRITLGVIEHDLYAAGMNFVFGEAELNGSRAIVSVYRLKSFDRGITKERLLKEAIHEIGHVLGLKHCKNSYCVMRFSNSVADVDSKSLSFCSLCASKIRSYLKI